MCRPINHNNTQIKHGLYPYRIRIYYADGGKKGAAAKVIAVAYLNLCFRCHSVALRSFFIYVPRITAARLYQLADKGAPRNEDLSNPNVTTKSP